MSKQKIRAWFGSRLKQHLYFGVTVFLYLLIVLSACSYTKIPQVEATPAQEIILYNWEDDIPHTVLDTFTARSGIKVAALVYDSQEEAIENLRAGKIYDVLTMESRFIPKGRSGNGICR